MSSCIFICTGIPGIQLLPFDTVGAAVRHAVGEWREMRRGYARSSLVLCPCVFGCVTSGGFGGIQMCGHACLWCGSIGGSRDDEWIHTGSACVSVYTHSHGDDGEDSPSVHTGLLHVRSHALVLSVFACMRVRCLSTGLLGGGLSGGLIRRCWPGALYGGGGLMAFLVSLVLLGKRGAAVGAIGGICAGGTIGALISPTPLSVSCKDREKDTTPVTRTHVHHCYSIHTRNHQRNAKGSGERERRGSTHCLSLSLSAGAYRRRDKRTETERERGLAVLFTRYLSPLPLGLHAFGVECTRPCLCPFWDVLELDPTRGTCPMLHGRGEANMYRYTWISVGTIGLSYLTSFFYAFREVSGLSTCLPNFVRPGGALEWRTAPRPSDPSLHRHAGLLGICRDVYVA